MKQATYFIAYAQSDKIILGIGETKKEARQDASSHVDDWNLDAIEEDRISKNDIKTIECTKETFNHIKEHRWNRWDDSLPWSITSNGIACLDEEIEEEQYQDTIAKAKTMCLATFRKQNISDKLDILFLMLKH